jgi:hypothetical protein
MRGFAAAIPAVRAQPASLIIWSTTVLPGCRRGRGRELAQQPGLKPSGLGGLPFHGREGHSVIAIRQVKVTVIRASRAVGYAN